jgi:hypothetical protein
MGSFEETYDDDELRSFKPTQLKKLQELHVRMPSLLVVHFSRVSELERPDYLITNPSVPIEGYRDSFGNWCSRLVAPSGHFSLGTDAIIRDSGLSDPIDLNALQHQV